MYQHNLHLVIYLWNVFPPPPYNHIISLCSSIMLQTVNDWLWWDRLWLPENVSWSDLEDSGGRVYAKVTHLYATLPCALCLLLVRFAFERWERTCGNMISPSAGGCYYTTVWCSHRRDYFAQSMWGDTWKSRACGGLGWESWWGRTGSADMLSPRCHAVLLLQVCGDPAGRCLGHQGQDTSQTGGKPAPGKLLLPKGTGPITGRSKPELGQRCVYFCAADYFQHSSLYMLQARDVF